MPRSIAVVAGIAGLRVPDIAAATPKEEYVGYQCQQTVSTLSAAFVMA